MTFYNPIASGDSYVLHPPNKRSGLLKAQAKEREQHQKEIEKLQQEVLATQRSQIQELLKTDVNGTF